MDDLLSEFIAETRETLEALTGEVIAWEADPTDRARLDSIFRFVHTVKGSCGFLDLPRFEELSHAAEDVLAELRAGKRHADVGLVSAVLAVIDRIGELTEALEAGETVAGDDAHLIAALRADAALREPIASVPQVAHQTRAPVRSIRIPLDLLDRLMSGVSDTVLARNELARRLRDIDEPGMEAAFDRLSTCVAEMRDSITRTRMQRIEKLFGALPRMVRDLSADLGKQVELEIDGSDVELDREMIELIRDPLTHIIRNSVDHGIEAVDRRIAAGKPPTGRLQVTARQSGNQIVIEIVDDGGGIDDRKLVARAVAAGLIRADNAEAMSASERAALIFSPGLSTADAVSSISGRGVGMDVVRANIERIGGVIDLENRPGQGLKILIRVPLTLTIIAALTVTAGNQGFAIPRSAIEEICHDGGGAIRIDHLGGASVATIRGRTLPLVNLETVLGLPGDIAQRGRTLVVLRAGFGCTYALGVGAVHDHEELVIKPASPAIMSAGIYAGKSLPDSGVPMLLLDVAGIAEVAGVAEDEAAAATAAPVEAEADRSDLVSTLLFRDFAGHRLAVRLALVERIEDVASAHVSHAAGCMRIAVDGRILPLLGMEAPPADGELKIIRLNDGAVELAYAIDDVIDIIAAPSQPAAPSRDERFTGVLLVDGGQVELLDPLYLFSRANEEGARSADGPVCLIADADDPWMREILRPLVEAAGYRAAFADDPLGSRADILIVGDKPAPAVAAPGASILRLLPARPVNASDGVYRYDRLAVLEALQRTVSGAA